MSAHHVHQRAALFLLVLLVACAQLAAAKGPGKLRPKDVSSSHHGNKVHSSKHGKSHSMAEHFAKSTEVMYPSHKLVSAELSEEAKPEEDKATEAVEEEGPTGSAHHHAGAGGVKEPKAALTAPEAEEKDEATPEASADTHKQGQSSSALYTHVHSKNIAALLSNLAQQRIQFSPPNTPVVQHEQQPRDAQAALTTSEKPAPTAEVNNAAANTTQQQASVQDGSVAWEPLSSNVVAGSAAGGHNSVAAHVELSRDDVHRGGSVATASTRPTPANAGGVMLHRALPLHNAFRWLDSSVSTAAVPQEAAQQQPATTTSPMVESVGLPAPALPKKQVQQQQQQAVAAPVKTVVPAAAPATAPAPAPQGGNAISSAPLKQAVPAPAPTAAITPQKPQVPKAPAQAAPRERQPAGVQLTSNITTSNASKAAAAGATAKHGREQQSPPASLTTGTIRPAVPTAVKGESVPAILAAPATASTAAQHHHHTVEVIIKPWGVGGQPELLPAANRLPMNSRQQQQQQQQQQQPSEASRANLPALEASARQLAVLLVAAQLGVEQQLALLQPLLQSVGAADQHQQLQAELLAAAAAHQTEPPAAAATSSPAPQAVAGGPGQLLVWPALEGPHLSFAMLPPWQEDDEDALASASAADTQAWDTPLDIWPWLLAAAQAQQQ